MTTLNSNGLKLWIYDNGLKIIGFLLMAVILLFTYEVRCGINENKEAIKGKVDSTLYERDRTEIMQRLNTMDGKLDDLILLCAGDYK